MSEQASTNQSDNTNNDSTESLVSQHIESYEEFAANQAAKVGEHEAAVRESIYSYRDSAKQYGTNRSLYIGDGYQGVHFRTQIQTPKRSWSRHSWHGQRGSYGTRVYSSSDSRPGSWDTPTSGCAHGEPSSWWQRFWRGVGLVLSGAGKR